MALGLGVNRPSLDNGSPEITPQQDRSLALEQNTASLGKLDSEIDKVLTGKDVLEKFPEEVKGVIKEVLTKECYLQCGENAIIKDIKINHNLRNDETEITLKTFNSEISINPDKVLSDYKLNNNSKLDLEGIKSNIRYEALLGQAEKEQDKFNSHKDVLMNAFEKAADYRLGFIEQRQGEIESTSRLDRIMGKGPDPIPTIAEVSLGKEEILRHIPLTVKNDENFVKMVDSTVERLQSSEYRNMGKEFWDELKPTAVLPDQTIEDYLKYQPNINVESLKVNLAEHVNQQEEIRVFNTEKDELLSAFQQANNERLMSSIERDNEINNASRLARTFGRVPERIPSVAEQSLTREEILKYVDSKMAESETFQNMLNVLVERLDQTKDGAIETSFWDVSLSAVFNQGIDNLKESGKVALALGEATVVGGLNLFAEGFQGAGALGVGAGVAVANLDIDEGMIAFRGTFNELRAQNPDIELSEFSREVLANNKGVQWVGSQIQYRVAESVRAATEMWGEDAGNLVREGITAGGKIVGLGLARVPLNRAVTVGGNTVDYAYNASRSIFSSRNISNELSHMTLFRSQILESGKIGMPGDIFAGPISNANLTGWRLTLRTGLNPTRNFENITVTSDAFKPVTPIGVYTGWQRVMGHQYTPRGILDINTGNFTRTGINWSQVRNYGVDVTINASGLAIIYLKSKE